MLSCQKSNLISEYNTAETIVTINDLVQGLTNFNPQEGHIICEGLIQGPHLCIHTSKGSGIELIRMLLFMNNKLH